MRWSQPIAVGECHIKAGVEYLPSSCLPEARPHHFLASIFTLLWWLVLTAPYAACCSLLVGMFSVSCVIPFGVAHVANSVFAYRLLSCGTELCGPRRVVVDCKYAVLFCMYYLRVNDDHVVAQSRLIRL